MLAFVERFFTFWAVFDHVGYGFSGVYIFYDGIGSIFVGNINKMILFLMLNGESVNRKRS